MKKTIVFMSLFFALSLFVLSACTGNGNTSTSSDSASGEEVAMTIEEAKPIIAKALEATTFDNVTVESNNALGAIITFQSVENQVNSVIKIDRTQDPARLYVDLDIKSENEETAAQSREIYIVGDEATIVHADGTVEESTASILKLEDYVNGASTYDTETFDAIIDCATSCTARQDGDSLIIALELDGEKALESGAIDISGLPEDTTMHGMQATYTIDGQGRLTEYLMVYRGAQSIAAFSVTLGAKYYDYGTTVVPEYKAG
ncbi:MAG: hypothetical protein IJ113_06640 [Eggerthellaceae bacterium]|nr:hypothetical protein [Eggerthellaceae bacterium]